MIKIAAARAGDVFGHKQIAGTCIVPPDDKILTKTEKFDEDITYADLDLDLYMMVRNQKYQGERSQPQVLYQKLKKHINEQLHLLS